MEQRAPHSPTFSDSPTYCRVGQSGEEWRTDGESAVDWLGSVFRIGDRVMYCIGAGRGQMMAIGTVKQIRSRGDAVEVQVLTERTSGHWNNKSRSKPAWVNPMNITSFVNLLHA